MVRPGLESKRLVRKLVKSESGGEDEEVRPEEEKLAGAVVWIAGEGEGGDGPEEGGGERMNGAIERARDERGGLGLFQFPAT